MKKKNCSRKKKNLNFWMNFEKKNPKESSKSKKKLKIYMKKEKYNVCI